MRLVAIVIGLGTSLALAGCSSVSTEEEDPAIVDSGVDLVTAPGFSFAMGEGSGRLGLNLFRVHANGTGSYVFRRGTGTWHKSEFIVDPITLQRLRETLADVEVFALKREYHDTAVIDGEQWCIRVEADGVTKRIYCNNHFPAPIVRLSDEVRAILAEHASTFGSAQQIERADSDREAADVWPRRDK